MAVLRSLQVYYEHASRLSTHWQRPLIATAFKLVASRVRHARGPVKFDDMQFTTKRVSQWNDYITSEELEALQNGLAPVEFRQLEDDKLAFAAHCARTALPTVPITAIIAPGVPSPLFRESTSTASDMAPIARTASELQAILAPLGDIEGFAKPMTAGQGYGAFGFSKQGDAIHTKAGTGSIAELFERCHTSVMAPDGYLLQPRVRPHRDLLPVMTGPALGTARLLTFLHGDGSVVIPWAWLKCPAPDAECDNTRFGTLVASIDVATGALRSAVGDTPARPVTHTVDTHPVSGVRFDAIVVPHWAEVFELVQRAARAFSMLPALGWDVAITNDGPILIEANVNFGTLEKAHNEGHRVALNRLYAGVVASRHPERSRPPA